MTSPDRIENCIRRALDALARAATKPLNEVEVRKDILACIQRLKDGTDNISVKECRQRYHDAIKHLVAAKAFFQWIGDKPRTDYPLLMTYAGGLAQVEMAEKELCHGVQMLSELEAWCSRAVKVIPHKGKKPRNVAKAIMQCIAPWDQHAGRKISFKRDSEGNACGHFIEFCAAILDAAGMGVAPDSIGRGIVALRKEPLLGDFLRVVGEPDRMQA